MGTLKEDTDRLIRQYNTDEGAQRTLRNMLETARADDYNFILKQLTSTHSRILVTSTAALPNTPLATLFAREVQRALVNTSTTEVFAKALCNLDGADQDLTLTHLCRVFDLNDVQVCLLAVCLMNFSKNVALRKESVETFGAKYQLLLRHVGIKSQSESMPPSEIAVLARHLLLNQGCASTLSHVQKFVIEYTLFQRYQDELPQPVQEFFEDYNNLRAAEDQSKSLAQLFEETRGAATSTITSATQILVRRNIAHNADPESEIANLLVALINSQTQSEAWNGDVLGRVVQMRLPHLDWTRVIQSLDRPDLAISTVSDFAIIIKTLRGAANQGQRSLPVDLLWSEWRHAAAQAAMIKQLTQSPLELFNMTDYSGPTVLSANDFVSAPPALKNLAAQLEMSPWNSLQLLQTSLRLLGVEEASSDAKQLLELAGKSTPELIFLGCVQLPEPWVSQQEQLSEKGFDVFFSGQPNHQLVFYRLWQVEPEFMCRKFIAYHDQDSLAITRILDIAQDLRLLDQLLNLQPYSFSLDLASLASRRELLDIDKWLDHQLSGRQDGFIAACLRFLSSKAEAENMLQQSEGSTLPVTVSLRVETVAVFLKALMNSAMSAENGAFLKQVQSSCLQVYPRLMNSTNVNRDPTDSNNFAKDVEKEVEYYYGRLYEGEMSIAHFVEMLQSLKQSDEARDQDVFACMLHSLFDEYRFFADYPASALSITAILFGCLIQNQLLSYIPLGIALRYILDAVAYDADNNMFKFGVQALNHFKERVPEWPQYCQQILAIPSLNEHEPALLAQIRNGQRSTDNGSRPSQTEAAAPQTSVQRPGKAVFRSLRVESLPHDPAFYSDPSEDVSDRILFNINNMSLTNLSEKLAEVHAAMEEKYFVWFAEHLVSQRAAIEPNYHSLYIHFLEGMNSEALTEHVLLQTIESISLLLNSENTVTSTVERSNLKNLGAWLGGLTLARNRPLKHKVISLKDLLLEGFDSGRLIVVLPFVCRILEQTPASKVFKPPNPWTMGILALLVELYENADMKLNLKFEVEVLCKKLEVTMSDVTPSTLLTNRPNIPDEQGSFQEEDAQTVDSRANSNLAFEQNAAYVNAVVGDMPVVIHPIIQQSLGIPNMRKLILLAVERAVRDIIGPVVERSVAIASISTSQLISKDFAMEADIGKLRRAAHTMNQNLAGSLALITCKELLRAALAINIRTLLGQAGIDTAGAQVDEYVTQLVNDHVDASCMIVEKATMERASSEIDEGLAAGFQARQKHHEQRSTQPFVDAHAPRHQYPLPDPLRLRPEGLTTEQLSTYDDFARIPRTAQQAAAYYAKEDLRQAQHDQPFGYRGEQPPAVAFEQILSLIAEVEVLAREADAPTLADVPADSQLAKLLQQVPFQVTAISGGMRDERTLVCSQKVCQLLFKSTFHDLAAECLTFLLSSFIGLSNKTQRDVSIWLVHSDDPRKYNAKVIRALMRAQIISPAEFDVQLAKQINMRQTAAIDFAIELINLIDTTTGHFATRTDFTASLDALQALARNDNAANGAGDLLAMLSVPLIIGDGSDDLFKTQLEAIFNEWVHLVNHPSANDRNQLAFLLQMQKSGVLSSDESCTAFFRAAIEHSVGVAQQVSVASVDPVAHYVPLDAAAKLTVLMMKYQVNERMQEACINNFRRIINLAAIIFAHQHAVKPSLDQRPMFRFFSSLFSELHKHSDVLGALYSECLSSLADVLIVLQPGNFPGCAFAWTALITHRFFMPQLLSVPDQAGWKQYADMMVSLLRFVGPSLDKAEMSASIRVLYHAILRLLLVLLNDFPNLLTNNHQIFCNQIPSRCVQLRNLILSSFPRKMRLPDPFLPGLKVDRLPETALSPEINMDLEQVLIGGKVMTALNNYIYSGNLGAVPKVIKALTKTKQDGLDPVLLNTLVLHCAVQAIGNAGAPPTFDVQSPWVALLNELFSLSDQQGRYQVLGAIANQLRYPNSHTYFFSCVLLLLFSSSSEQDYLIKEQITRVLLERLICNRPHPWGLLITFTELLKNSKYNFWSLPFIRVSPEIEKLFQSLFSHINQNIEASPQ